MNAVNASAPTRGAIVAVVVALLLVSGCVTDGATPPPASSHPATASPSATPADRGVRTGEVVKLCSELRGEARTPDVPRPAAIAGGTVVRVVEARGADGDVIVEPLNGEGVAVARGHTDPNAELQASRHDYLGAVEPCDPSERRVVVPLAGPGCRGPLVAALQRQLGLVSDGLWGPETRTALEVDRALKGMPRQFAHDGAKREYGVLDRATASEFGIDHLAVMCPS